jgi:hypothetical protein
MVRFMADPRSESFELRFVSSGKEVEGVKIRRAWTGEE